MRYYIAALLFFMIALPVSAETGIPDSSFWYEPTSFAPGDTVTFTALVYNSENAEAVFTVALLDNKKNIQEKQIAVPVHDARAIQFIWKATNGEHVFEVAIQSARSGSKTLLISKQFEKTALQVGGGASSSGRIDDIEAVVKTKSRSIFTKIDSWRVKKLAQYEDRKTELKQKIDASENSDQFDNLAEPDRLTDDVTIVSHPFLPTPASVFVYLEYFLYIVLTFIFSAALFFYIAGGFLLFLVLRFFYVRMV